MDRRPCHLHACAPAYIYISPRANTPEWSGGRGGSTGFALARKNDLHGRMHMHRKGLGNDECFVYILGKVAEGGEKEAYFASED